MKRLISRMCMLTIMLLVLSLPLFGSNTVKVGFPALGPITSELNVNTISKSTGVYSEGATFGVYGVGKYGLYGAVDYDSTSMTKYGVYGTAEDSNPNYAADSYGVYGEAITAVTGNMKNVGVRGYGTGEYENYGIYGSAYQGYNVFGVYGYASNGYTNYGIYGKADGGASRYAGYFDGNVTINGSLSYASDEKLKTNIKDIGGALTTIKKLKPRKYNFKKDNKIKTKDSNKSSYGFIAQELEAILPDLVATETGLDIKAAIYDDEGIIIEEEEIIGTYEYASINYMEIIPLLVKAIQELTVEVDQLKK